MTRFPVPRRALAALLLAPFLAGCALFGGGADGAGTAPAEPRPGARAVTTVPAPAASIALAPRDLAPGECGLFLFTRGTPRQFVFFRAAGADVASYAAAKGETVLRAAGEGGTLFGQFNTEQRFLSPDGRLHTLSFAPGAPLEGGQRIRDGRLVIESAEGWETVVPMEGVRSCVG